MKRNSENIRIAVLGLGNELLRDDGVGVHAVRMLEQVGIEGVTIAEIGTSALSAQQILVETDHVIAIDAVHHDGCPGTIYTFDAEDEKADCVFSLHDLGIIGAVNLLPKELRPKVQIVGVEPEIIEYGLELSDTVGASLQKVIEIVQQTIKEIKEAELEKVVTNPQVSIVRN